MGGFPGDFEYKAHPKKGTLNIRHAPFELSFHVLLDQSLMVLESWQALAFPVSPCLQQTCSPDQVVALDIVVRDQWITCVIPATATGTKEFAPKN